MRLMVFGYHIVLSAFALLLVMPPKRDSMIYVRIGIHYSAFREIIRDFL